MILRGVSSRQRRDRMSNPMLATTTGSSSFSLYSGRNLSADGSRPARIGRRRYQQAGINACGAGCAAGCNERMTRENAGLQRGQLDKARKEGEPREWKSTGSRTGRERERERERGAVEEGSSTGVRMR